MKMEQTQCSERSAIPIAYGDGTDTVPKRRLLNNTRRGTTQKIARNI
jgi:hypothetical protein